MRFSSEYWLTNMQCTGDEKKLQDCKVGYYRARKCLPDLDVAGVICVKNEGADDGSKAEPTTDDKLGEEYYIKWEA